MEIYIDPNAYISALLIILDLAMLTFMWRVKNKSTATRFLMFFFVCLLLNNMAMFWSNGGTAYQYLLIPTQDALLITGGIGLMGFAYHYPRNDQPREARLIMAVFASAALVAFAFNLYFGYDIISTGQPRSSSVPFKYLMPLTLLLAIAVFMRRSLHFAAEGLPGGAMPAGPALRALWRPPNRGALALRDFGLALAVGIIQAVASAGFIPHPIDTQVLTIGAILAIGAIALAYINHAPEPTSFMVKLVGASLILMLAALGVNGVTIIENRLAAQLQLVKTLGAAAPHVDSSALADSGVRYIVDWPATPGQYDPRLIFRQNDEPLDSPAAVLASHTPGHAPDPTRIELMAQAMQPWPVSIPRIVAVYVPHQGRILEVGFSNYDMVMTPVHQEAMRQIWLVVISSGVVLFLFPLFFRGTLVTPLNNLLRGIRQANQGQLDVAVPVLQNDELGQLTGSFNQMVESLRQSQSALAALNRDLEQRVTARTEELSTFFDLTVLAGQGAGMAEVIQQALPQIMEVGHIRAICLHLIDEGQTNLRLAAQQNLPADAASMLQQVSPPPEFQRWLATASNPLSTSQLPALNLLPPPFHLDGYQTYLGAPVKTGGKIEGLLSCYRRNGNGFGADEISLVSALAEQLGIMLETHRLRQTAREMAILEERQRLARDLHDSVTQSLYGLSLLSGTCREAADDGDSGRLNHSLTLLEQNTLHILREMRLLLYELRPADLEREGLERAISQRLAGVEQRVGLRLDVAIDELPAMPPACEIELYHIIVEALNNVVKHAAANRLTLRLTHTGQRLHLLIADNGRGFNPLTPTGGQGLRNIRERVAKLNGRLVVTSQPGEGARLEATFPLPTEQSI